MRTTYVLVWEKFCYGKSFVRLGFLSFDITKLVYILNINIPLINYCRLDRIKSTKVQSCLSKSVHERIN